MSQQIIQNREQVTGSSLFGWAQRDKIKAQEAAAAASYILMFNIWDAVAVSQPELMQIPL